MYSIKWMVYSTVHTVYYMNCAGLYYRCVHCKHFEPTWKAIAKHFEKNPDITICKVIIIRIWPFFGNNLQDLYADSFLQVDCTKESSKCQELKINGFPMLKLYKDGEEVRAIYYTWFHLFT